MIRSLPSRNDDNIEYVDEDDWVLSLQLFIALRQMSNWGAEGNAI
jgi:hypothetical protein